MLFENVCVHPLSYSNEVNINTMDADDNYFLTSIFPNISLTDAEFIISKIPENGFKTTDEFISSFSEFNLSRSIFNNKNFFKTISAKHIYSS